MLLSVPRLRFVSGSTSFHANGQQFSTTDGSLSLASSRIGNGSDAFGAYLSVTWTWTSSKPQSPPLLWETGVREYTRGASFSLVFSQRWVSGAQGTSTGDRAGVLSSFPSFQLDPSEPVLPPLGFIQWAGTRPHLYLLYPLLSHPLPRPAAAER